MGGGGKTGIDALARASGRGATATRGRLFRFREREGKALGVLHRDCPAIQPTTAPLHGVTPPHGLRPDLWASGRPARKEARVLAGQRINAAPLGAQSAGKSATIANPAQSDLLLIVTRMGRDYRPGARKRIEQVAREGSAFIRQSTSS